MKTINSLLKKMNIEELVDAYIKKYPHGYDIILENYNQMDLNEVKKEYKKKIRQFINQLKKVKIQRLSIDEKLIAFAYERYSFGCANSPMFIVCKINDFKMRKEYVNKYKLDFKKYKEAMGIYIVETPFTKLYINELIIYVLYRLMRSKVSQKYSKMANVKTQKVKENHKYAYTKLLHRGSATRRWLRMRVKRREIRKVLRII